MVMVEKRLKRSFIGILILLSALAATLTIWLLWSRADDLEGLDRHVYAARVDGLGGESCGITPDETAELGACGVPLKRMGEPSLFFARGCDVEVYRFVWVRSW